VRSGAVVVAFVRELAADAELVHDVLVREPLAVLLPPRHPLARSPRLRVEALAHEPFVHFPRDVAPTLYDHIQARCQRAGFVPRVVQEVREWLTEISLVQAGIGVALVPASFKRLRLGGVSCRPLLGRAEPTTIALCYRREGLSPAAAGFIHMARELAARASRIARG
jgi:DNA-binding transcriptional LysR family regulator